MFSYPQPASVNCAFPVIRETVPRSKLGYDTNNLYPEFPPLMSDGRAVVASHQPEAILNANLISQNNITSNWQYRQYLTNNSTEVARQNFREASNDVGYFERFLPNELGNNDPMNSVPFTYSSYLENDKPQGYANSDLKDMYLSREQLNARKYAPAITQEQLFHLLQTPIVTKPN